MGLRETTRKIDRRSIRLWAFGLLVAATWLGLRRLAPFADRGVSEGILALELSADGQLAQGLVEDIDAAQQALLYDFAFIAGYTVALMLALWLLVPLFRLNLLRTNVRALAIAPLAAAALDAAENVLLLIGTGPGEWTDGWFQAAAALAFAKFVIIVGLLLLLVGAAASGLTTPQWLYTRMAAEPRRQQVKLPDLAPQRGIALSGGGVRAASVSLGALQELEQDPQPMGWCSPEVTRVTAVSGGAYMGGAWQLGREGPGASPTAWARQADGTAGPEEQHLLNNLGYLTTTFPRGRPEDPGAPDTLNGVNAGRRRHTKLMRSSPAVWATVLTGFLVNAVVLTAVICVLTIPLGIGYDWLTTLGGTCVYPERPQPVPRCLVVQPRSWFPPVAWLGAWLVLSLLWTFAGKVLRRAPVLAFLKLVVQASLAIGVILGILLLGVPLLVALLQELPAPGVLLAGLASAVGVVVAVGRMLRSLVATLAPKLGGLAFGLLLLIGIGSVARAAWAGVLPGSNSNPIWWWWGALALLGLTWFCFSPELWSLFAFYRGKLRSAYALRRDGNLARPYVNDTDDDTAAGLLREPDLGYDSKLTICASAHATTKAVRTHYGIPAMSFTFEDKAVRMYVPQDDQGSSEVYECSLVQLQAAYNGAGLNVTTKRITTMFAVALSGAAVSPAMGRFRIGPTSMLLAFTNVRLGSWIPNPRYVRMATTLEKKGNTFPVVRLGYLVKEFLGLHDPTDAFVYVSDGGHWENTGLVELLRRQMPDEVLVIDADAGRAPTVRQLTQAIDLAKLECDVDVFVDLEPLRGFAAQEGGPVFAKQSVTVGVIRQKSKWGLIWYSKPILTLDSPTPLLAHREIDATFPATSTLDQFFDTSTYVAYRDLGRDNIAQIKVARKKLKTMLADCASPSACLDRGDRDDLHWVERAFIHLLDQQSEGEQQQLLVQVKAVLNRPAAAGPSGGQGSTAVEPAKAP